MMRVLTPATAKARRNPKTPSPSWMLPRAVLQADLRAQNFSSGAEITDAVIVHQQGFAAFVGGEKLKGENI
ncbi:MAG: hypothetical protein WA919_19525 [Coleofasciculaceae cyanobacterium]